MITFFYSFAFASTRPVSQKMFFAFENFHHDQWRAMPQLLARTFHLCGTMMFASLLINVWESEVDILHLYRDISFQLTILRLHSNFSVLVSIVFMGLLLSGPSLYIVLSNVYFLSILQRPLVNDYIVYIYVGHWCRWSAWSLTIMILIGRRRIERLYYCKVRISSQGHD